MRVLLSMLLSAALLVACGRAAPPSDAASKTPANEAARLRVLNDAVGRALRLPQTPQRVVVLSELDLDSLLALELRPAGATDARGSNQPPRYLGERTRGIDSVGNFAAPSVDRILMAQPDLILAGGHPDAQLLEQLQAIAPTAVSCKVGEPWQDSFLRIARLVNRESQAQSVIEQYQRRADALRTRLDVTSGAVVSIVRLSPNGPLAMLGEAFAGRVMRDLGFTRPPAQSGPGAGHAPPLSREALQQIDADWLFIGNFTPDPQSVAALRSEPAFTRLSVARRGHVREVDASLWTMIGGPLAAQAVLDDVERLLPQRLQAAAAQ